MQYKSAKSLQAAENQLFDDWDIDNASFVRDGVVSPSAYLESQLRICIILKEVNDEGGGGWDLREFVAQGGRTQTWNNIARWVHGIRHLPDIVPWSMLRDVDVNFRISNLCDIAVLNLKKTPGGHTSDPHALYTSATKDGQFIQKQYELYDPHLTICCGVGLLFKSLAHEQLPWQVTQRGIQYYQTEPVRFVVGYSHPAARISPAVLHYALIDAVKEIYA